MEAAVLFRVMLGANCDYFESSIPVVRKSPCNTREMQKRLPQEGSLCYADRLNIKTVIALVAIQAQLITANQADPIGAGRFTTAIADVGMKYAGFFGKGDRGFPHIEHLFRTAGLIIGKGLLSGHACGLGFHHQADRFAGLPVIERIGGFTTHVEKQITLADAAAQHHLDAVNTAGIVFCNADHLLIIGKLQV